MPSTAAPLLTPVLDSPWLGRSARDARGWWGVVRRVYDTPGAQMAVVVPERNGRCGAPRLELVELLRERGRPAANTAFFNRRRGADRLLRMLLEDAVTERGRQRYAELTALQQPFADHRSMVRYTLLSQLTPGDRVALDDGPTDIRVTALGEDHLEMTFPQRPDVTVRVPMRLDLQFPDGTRWDGYTALQLMPTLGLTDPRS